MDRITAEEEEEEGVGSVLCEVIPAFSTLSPKPPLLSQGQASPGNPCRGPGSERPLQVP